METASERKATLGGGCFWCLEAVFEMLDGVLEVIPGYAGGSVEAPTYAQVCTGRTGHAEVVQVAFDSARIGYDDLLDVFFAVHDPTTVDRQGPDTGYQYRSIILYQDEAQLLAARSAIARVTAPGACRDPVVTEVVPLEAFYPAEEQHRGYYRRHPDQAYCRAVIRPKVARSRSAFGERVARDV